MSKEIDLNYVLGCLSELSDAKFETAVTSGKVGFVNRMMTDLKPGQLARLARKARKEAQDA